MHGHRVHASGKGVKGCEGLCLYASGPPGLQLGIIILGLGLGTQVQKKNNN